MTTLIEKEDKKEWFGPFDRSPSRPTKKRSYLIILNTPIRSEEKDDLFRVIWESTDIHICADGGANQLYNFSKQHLTDLQQSSKLIPDYIKGDLDSIKPQVKLFYEQKKCRVMFDSDQDTTDLGKCLSLTQEIEKERGSENQMNHSDGLLVIHGGLSGRLDQTIHTLHALLCLHSPSRPLTQENLNEKLHQHPQSLPEIWVIDTDARSMACALQPGLNHLLHIPKHWRQGPHPLTCGILPLGINQATITTDGLKWDLDKTKTSMGGLLSTSNHILPETEVVKIKTDETVIWTMEIPCDM